MPVSKKRKLAKQPRFKNIVRGNSGNSASLDVVRAMVPLTELTDLADWAVKAYGVRGALKGIVPKSPSEINDKVPLSPLSFERELAWALGILRSNIEGLRNHVELRARLDCELLKDDKVAALNTVGEMESAVCWSLELLAFKIALLSDTQGLEAQKHWISSHSSHSKSVATRFFGYWFGVRAERFSNPEGYLQEIERKIPLIARDEIGLPYLYYQLTGQFMNEREQASILASHNLHSFVDQYECCVHLAKEASVGSWEKAEYWFHWFLPLMRELGDPRLTKIAALMGQTDYFNELPVREPIFRTRPPTSNGEIGEEASVNDLFDAALGEALSGTARVQVDRPLWKTLQKLHRAGRDHTDASGELHKTSLLYPRTSIGEWCESVRKYDFRQSLQGSHEFVLRRFLLTDTLEVDAIGAMHPSIRCKYTEYVLKGVSDPRAREYSNISAGITKVRVDEGSLHDPFLADAGLSRCVISSDLKGGGELAAKIRELRGVTSKRQVQIEVIALLDADRILDAVTLVSSTYRLNNSLVSWMPWQEIAGRLDDRTVDQLSYNIDTSLVCWLLGERYDQSFQSSHSYAIEGYLSSQGMETPSEIPIELVKSSEALQHFLRHQCTIDALSLSLAYEGPRSLEKQRIDILRNLKSANEDLAIECDEEIAHILRAQEVTKAIASLQKSKISMDEEPLREWARDNLRNKFERYRAYVHAGLLPVGDDYVDYLISILKSESSAADPYAIPDNDAATLFIDLVNELSREFSLNPKHGLNAYLSLRIRHGTVAGQLRRPCQEQNMLTMVEANNDNYPLSKHWFSVLSEELGPPCALAVANCFSEFSRQYDEAISDFANEYVQIARQEKPKGLFEYQLADTSVLSLAFDTMSVEDFDDFLDEFLRLYWIHMARVLEEVRDHVHEKLSVELLNLINKLEADANLVVSPIPTTLRDALVRARVSLADALAELEAWFDVPQVVESAPLLVIDLAEVGKEMVCQLHPDFKPNMVVHDEFKRKLAGVLTVFTDIFFLLIGNVEKHSGVRDPNIDVYANEIDGKTIQIVVESDCNDVSRHRHAVERANEKLRLGNYESDVSREGGSGFYKLAKLVAGSKAEDKLEISLDDTRSKFQIALRFNWLPIGAEREKADHAIVAG